MADASTSEGFEILTLTAFLLTPDERRMDERAVHLAHAQFLRPLLAVAANCWVYGLVEGSDVSNSAGDIVTFEKGKHRVALHGDPVTGRELFWNATGSKRGSIVVAAPIKDLDPGLILRASKSVGHASNFRSGHTPAGINLAKKLAKSGIQAAFCFPRSNGIEWVDIFADEKFIQILLKNS